MRTLYIIQICYLLFFSIAINAQQKKYDLYIVISPESNIKIVRSNNVNTYLSVYFLPFKVCDSAKQNFEINEKGELITSHIIKGFSTPIIKLTYFNKGGVNPPKIIEKNQKLNIISYDDYFQYRNFNNLYNLLEGAANLYLIEKDTNAKEFFFVAKKVKLDLL